MNHKAKEYKAYLIFLLLTIIFIGMGAGLFIWKKHQKKHPLPGNAEKPYWPSHDLHADKPFSTGYNGIDISSHQGKIRWDSLATARPGMEFIYVRARGLKGMDNTYAYNMKQARSHGFKVGSYHFFNMGYSVEDQYRQFTRMTDFEHQDLRPVIDVESQSLTGEGNEHLKDSVIKFTSLLEAHFGCKPVIYSNQSFYIVHLHPAFNSYPLWIANYSRMPRIKGVKPILWQKSETGHVHGIWTYVDLDQYINGGSIQDLLIPEATNKLIRSNDCIE